MLTFLSLTSPQLLMLGLMFFMVMGLIFDWFSPDLMAMIVLIILGVSGLLPTSMLFSGFSSNAVIALIAVMIIGRGLERSGWVSFVAAWVFRRGRGHPKRTLWLLMGISGLGAGFLRSAGVTALLLPVVSRLSVLLKTSKSQLLMPVAFCAIIGGSLTMVGSGPLLMLNDLLRSSKGRLLDINYPLQGIHMFSLFFVGLGLLVLAMLFLKFFGIALLPKGEQESFSMGLKSDEFQKIYGFGGNFFEIRVLPGSPLLGKNISDLEKQLDDLNIAILAMTVGTEVMIPPLRRMDIRLSSRLAFLGEPQAVEAFCLANGLRVRSDLFAFAEVLNPLHSGFSEIVIPPGSPLIGTEVNELHMRRRYGAHVLSIFRDSRYFKGEEMRKLKIKSGDTLGLFSDWESLAKLEKQHDFAVVTTDFPREKQCDEKKFQSLFIFLGSIALLIFSPFPAAVSLLIGAALMILTRVINIEEAYRSIGWQTVFLLAGLIPFGLAMQETGTAQIFSQWILAILPHHSHEWAIFFLAILGGLFGLAMSNVGATVVLVPVSIHLANQIGGDPRLFAIVTALSTSNAFMLPTHQSSTLIFSAGHYRVKDFLKVGGLMSLVYLAGIMLLQPLM